MLFGISNSIVKMLQYTLKKEGITNYYFMDAGTTAALKQGYDKNAVKK